MIIASTALLSATPALAGQDSPYLRARPTSAAQHLPAGVSDIGGTAVAYRPAAASGPMPLLVLLHPAGGNGRRFLEQFRPFADRMGFIILAPQSSASTWDVARRRHFGPDVQRIDAALAQLFASTPIDRSRIAIGGFSDGASYALSLGLANPQLFRGVFAMSPGFVTEAGPYAGQRVFVAHGRRDSVLPFTFAERDLVSKLDGGGARVRFKPFEGGHEVDEASLQEGLRFTLGLR
ncbi:MAG TPA: hypothetical protein VIL42_04415 [Sphingomicrobium sp.]